MNNSTIINTTARILFPFLIVFGAYVVINGADSVGGGFQGGAVLSSAFIVRYLILPDQDIDLRHLKTAERVFILALFAAGMMFIGRAMDMPYLTGRVWMVGINLLIGVKVTCGLTIIFYRFVFFEGSEGIK